MKPRLVWLLLCGIWGSTWLFIKLGLENLPPFTFAGIRFVIAVAILFIIVKLRGLSLPTTSRDWVLLIVSGVPLSLQLRIVVLGRTIHFLGLWRLSAIDHSAFGLVIAHFYLPGEKMTAAKILGSSRCGWKSRDFANQLDVLSQGAGRMLQR